MKTIYCEPCVTAGRAGMKCETCGAVVARGRGNQFGPYVPLLAEGVPYRVVRMHDEVLFEKLCEGSETEDDVRHLRAEVRRLRDALEGIAKSYPTTDEGETLADIAREALYDEEGRT